MGVSTDAKLFYGFPIDEDSKAHEMIADYDGDGAEDKPKGASLGWLANSGESDCGVTIGYHCSDEVTMYYVAIEKSEKTACRGYPEPIKDLKPGDDWHRRIQSFCEAYGIKPGKIGWWMCSYWG